MDSENNNPLHDARPAVPLPMEGMLDLHTFQPWEAIAVLEAFLEESRARNWREVRIVHGKGTGMMRDRVAAHLKKSPHVASFRPGDETSGSWGATWVVLRTQN